MITPWPEFQTGWQSRVRSWWFTGFALVRWVWHPRAHPCRGGGLALPAVCVPPGAQLMLLDVPKRLQHDLAVGPIEGVTFVQLGATPYQFRDAVRFQNGRHIRLQDLSEGMPVRVLKLSLPEDYSFEPIREERNGVFVE